MKNNTSPTLLAVLSHVLETLYQSGYRDESMIVHEFLNGGPALTLNGIKFDETNVKPVFIDGRDADEFYCE